ncbi:MAG: hypothetical protein ACREYB_09325 [Casimicrobiaceae bacterium]
MRCNYRYKLDWLTAATGYLRIELAQHPQLAVIGDLNIAPEDRDAHDPDLWRNRSCARPTTRRC